MKGEISLDALKTRLYEFFSDEARWTSGCYARDADGNECGYQDDDASCFCLAGAIARMYPRRPVHNDLWLRISEDIREHTEFAGPTVLNDDGGYGAVMNYLKTT